MSDAANPWNEVGLDDGMVPAGRVETALRLTHGTVAADYRAGRIAASPRKARRGKAALWLLSSEAWRVYGPKKLESRRK